MGPLIFFMVIKNIFSAKFEKKIFFEESTVKKNLVNRPPDNIGRSHILDKNHKKGKFNQSLDIWNNKISLNITNLNVKTFSTLGVIKNSSLNIRNLLRNLPIKQAGIIKRIKASKDFLSG